MSFRFFISQKTPVFKSDFFAIIAFCLFSDKIKIILHMYLPFFAKISFFGRKMANFFLLHIIFIELYFSLDKI